ncbi:MAG: hypothetical protein ABFR97_05590 [Thermodesulfobacteriota bacterium]
MKRIILLAITLGSLFSGSVLADTPGNDTDYARKLVVPEQLQAWVPWVMYGVERKKCSKLFSQNNKSCLWAGPLRLNVSGNNATFAQKITLEYPGIFYLPGQKGRSWPQGVTLDSAKAMVVEKGGRPIIHIKKAGSYTIKGNFSWQHLPESLTIPPATGLTSLILNGKREENLTVKQGKIWFHLGQKGETRARNSLQLRVNRLITDSAPLKITSRIELRVSGDPREVVLDWQVPENQIPLAMESDLPVKLEKDRKLRVQIRPGRWHITFATRMAGETNSLTIGQTASPWPTEELWSFQAQNHLRIVEVSGVNSVDPSQENVPPEWQKYPAYRMTAAKTLSLNVKKRGDATPAPDNLELQRTFWLDESGEGMTVKDKLTGSITSGWRLEMLPQYALGRASVNGRDQLITRVEEDGNSGIEVRQGRVEIETVSRARQISDLLAVGWDHDMKKVAAQLNLPPGWQLLHQSGIDSADSWVAKWTLFDIFIVLIISLSIWKLIGIKSGVLGLVTLVLTFHEPNAPRYIWLALLLCLAILKVIPENVHARHIRMAKFALLALLVTILVPFITSEIRHGLYPQLEKGRYHHFQPKRAVPTPQVAQKITMEEMDTEVAASADGVAKTISRAKGASRKIIGSVAPYPEERSAPQKMYDPAAKLQSGPGLPVWNWNRIQFSWNGPVAASQKIKLYFLTPMLSLILAFLVSALLVGLTFVFCLDELGEFKKGNLLKKFTLSLCALLFLAAPAITPGQAKAHESAIPDQELLDSLKEKLLTEMNRPDECGDHCLDIPLMTIEIKNDTLRLDMTVLAASQIGVALPQGANWDLTKILVNNKNGSLFKGRKGKRWALVKPGESHVVMSGPLFNQGFQLSFPVTTPKKINFSKNAEWEIQGLDANGIPTSQLGFQRINKDQKKGNKEVLEMGALPPLVQVERILHLGLDWKITTVATRLSPAGSPILIKVPLLKGESVVSKIPVRKEKVQLQLGARENKKSWESVLAKSAQISLTAFQSQNFTEVWTLDAGPMWHIELAGIPVVKQQTTSGLWQPQWHPWPGEEVTLEISKPKGVAGPTKTIESSNLIISPGLRATDYDLTFALRSTRGDSHTFKIPPGAEIQQIRINGAEQPIRQSGREVAIAVAPGEQVVNINWRMDQNISALFSVPQIDLGMESVNSAIEVNFGKRWIWFVKGPAVGPAILFYSELFIIVVGAILLGFIPFLPLRWYHWLILGLGLSQAGLIANGIIVCWFLALGFKKKFHSNIVGKSYFNLGQLAIICFSVVSFGCLLYAIQVGLLGHPDMLIEGNNSTNYALKWYQDRVAGPILPQPFILSLPLLAYRGIMLAWALWLSFSLLKWLRWGWQESFALGPIWDKGQLKKSEKKKPAAE